MKKPAIMLRLGLTTHKKLIALIESSSGRGRKISIVKHTDDTTLVIITHNYRALNLQKEVVCVKNTTIYTSKMADFFTNLLIKESLAFTYEPELEVPDSLQKLIKDFIFKC